MSCFRVTYYRAGHDGETVEIVDVLASDSIHARAYVHRDPACTWTADVVELVPRVLAPCEEHAPMGWTCDDCGKRRADNVLTCEHGACPCCPHGCHAEEDGTILGFKVDRESPDDCRACNAMADGICADHD